jgi:lysophospholipase L1-like esterase
MLSILLFFGLAELVTRVLQDQHLVYNFAKGEQNKAISKKKNFSPKLLRSENPKLFVENEPNQPGINQWGMRGKNVEKEKRRDVYRIALIGDSVTFGYGVSYEQSFAFLLEQQLNQQKQPRKVEVLNFSVNGYGLESYLEVLKTKVPAFKPDLIVIGYCLNDPAPTSVVFEAVGVAMKRNASYKELAKYSQFVAWVKYLYDNAFSRYQQERDFHRYYTDPAVLSTLDSEFIEARSLSEQENAKLLVMIYPYLTNFSDYQFSYVHALIAGMLSRHNIAGLDLYGALASESAENLRVTKDDFTHPNARGHQLIADNMTPVILRYLTENPPTAVIR